jgi:hypothetical protein
VTEQDVQQYYQNNPSQTPTVGDAVAPISPGAVGGQNNYSVQIPSTAPGTTPAPGTVPDTSQNTNPNAGQPKIDLGPNPNIPTPGLESIPTAEMIIAPIRNVFPALKNWAVPSHNGVCPTDSFDLWGQHYVLDAHCPKLEELRPVISGFMLVAWSLAALMVVLAA